MFLKIRQLYHSKRVIVNASLSVVQVIVLSLSYFFIYTILLKKLGVGSLGVWSLILATTSVANIAGLGLTSGLVKFIAMYSRDDDHQKINSLIRTGFITTGLFTGIFAFLLFLVSGFFLPLVMPANYLSVGLKLLPIALVSFWINNLGGIFLSSLDGLHHSSLRSIIYICSALFFSLLGFILIGPYGLYGIAIAQLCQSVFVLLLSLCFLKLQFHSFSLFPFTWDKASFNEIIGYSLNFQLIGILSLLTEPVSKYLLSRFSGLSFVGYYEMASRLISQIRGLLVSANQVLVPFVSSKYSNTEKNRDESYTKVLLLALYLASFIMLALIVLSPFIAYFWIGNFNSIFIFSAIVVSSGMFVNMISTPAYFSSIGMGKLKGILVSHIIILASNAVAGFILGQFFQGWGVVASYALAMILGSIVTMWYYHHWYHFSFLDILGKGIYTLYIMVVVVLLSVLLFFFKSHFSFTVYLFASFLLLVAYAGWVYFYNQLIREKLNALVSTYLFKTRMADGANNNH